MRNFLILFVFCISFLSFGQKIKEDDNKILFDGTAIAKVDKDKTGTQFTYTSLDGSTGIVANLKTHKIDAQNSKSWLVVTNLDGSKKTEVNFELLSFTLNYKKAIAELLAKKYTIFTAKGIENLDAFFAEERPSISAEIEKVKEAGKVDAKQLATLNYQIHTAEKLVFSGEVPEDAFTSKYSDAERKEFMSKVVAKYVVSWKQDSSPYPVLNVDILSLSGRSLVKAVDRGGKMVVALTESNKTFTYAPSFEYTSRSSAADTERLVKEVVDNSYLNGQKFMTLSEAEVLLSAQNADKMAKYEEAKKNSANIFDKKGYAIDPKGEKTEGKVTIDFERIAVPKSSNGMVDLDSGGDGKLVTVFGPNEKGNLRTFNFKAKENVMFGVYNDDNTETKYRALLVKIENVAPKDNTALDLGALAGVSLASASWKYFKEVQVTDKMSIYQDIPSNTYVIKVPKQEKGFQILVKKGKEDKFLSKLKEYVGDSVASSDLEKIDYSNLEGLKNLVDLYSNFK
ncbi:MULTISPECIES: hypothetical protein [Flavobacterium]|uniref:Uncharacterized protein n=1 Tax=Flavobacterium ginsengisoli TaxID=871694 RepID=A0ABP7ERY7_9FLAO|nr:MULTISPECIES: hypothetical protein [Flavobacterium]MBJ2123520.1 hypothetical protein [Flavobacterium sp. IB48]